MDVGSPAWQKGLRPEMELLRIGDSVNPYFQEITQSYVLKTGLPIGK